MSDEQGKEARPAAAALPDTSRLLTDEEVLRRAHRFVRSAGGSSSSDDDDDEGDKKRQRRAGSKKKPTGGGGDPTSASWVAPAVREYESKLFKEFAIADLSRATAAVLSAAAAAKARAERKE